VFGCAVIGDGGMRVSGGVGVGVQKALAASAEGQQDEQTAEALLIPPWIHPSN